MKYLIFFLIYFTHACPTTKEIKHEIYFDKEVIQEPFPYPYNGIDVFNGVKTQNKGICNNSTKKCIIPTKKCECLPYSKYLLFNLIPTHQKSLKPKDITTAVKEAKNITFINKIKLNPNTLCSYDVSEWSDTFSCLPKFCKGTTTVCLNSNHTCECIAEPCNLYIFI